MNRSPEFEKNRRKVLKGSLISGALMMGYNASAVSSAIKPNAIGRKIHETGEYGQPSKYSTATRIKSTGNGIHASSRTPLAESFGIITPSGLHFELHHGGVPSISPTQHKLLIHGMVNTSLIFSVQEIMDFPSITRTHFIECAGNTGSEWKRVSSPEATVQRTHGLTSCSEWTGVLLSDVLKKVGVKARAKWLLAEGDDSSRMARSIPLWKAMDDAMIVYAQNGELLREEQGFPLRLLVPGFEGNMNIKWLRRLEIGDKPWWTHQEVTEYADPRPNGKRNVFSYYMEVKSVITSPSSGMKLERMGYHEITGLAWSGRGSITKVEVSVDNGEFWQFARLQGPVHRKAHTRFVYDWEWRGGEAIILSRATDDDGNVQPDHEQLHQMKSEVGLNHNNAIQKWRVAKSGGITNVQ